jgi:hypothetical protein
MVSLMLIRVNKSGANDAVFAFFKTPCMRTEGYFDSWRGLGVKYFGILQKCGIVFVNWQVEKLAGARTAVLGTFRNTPERLLLASPTNQA